MTSRERWTVYPLLFLALGMGLRNRQMDVMRYDTIACEKMELIDKQGNPVAVLGITPKQDAMLQFMDSKQHVTALLGTTGSSGHLRLLGPDKQSWVNVGFDEPQAGMLVGLPANNVVRVPVMVNVPIKLPAKPATKTEAPQKESSENKSEPEPAPENPNPEAATPELPAYSAPSVAPPS